MSLYQKYELSDLLREGPVKTFAARERTSRRAVALHVFIGVSSQQKQELLSRVQQLSNGARSEVIELGDHDGTAYVVTREWVRPENFIEWLSGAPYTKEPPLPGKRDSAPGRWRVSAEEFRRKGINASAPPIPDPGPQPIPPSEPIPEPEPPNPVIGALEDFDLLFREQVPHEVAWPASEPPRIGHRK